MQRGYAESLAALTVAAADQLWITSVLLVTRQLETLTFAYIIACVFWAWCFRWYLPRKRHIGLLLTGLCLMAPLTANVLLHLDMLDTSDSFLFKLSGTQH